MVKRYALTQKHYRNNAFGADLCAVLESGKSKLSAALYSEKSILYNINTAVRQKYFGA